MARLTRVLATASLIFAAGPAAGALAAPAAWATVNLCDPPAQAGSIGVRVQVPAGPGAQWIRVRIQYYDVAAGSWRYADSGGDGGWTQLGAGGSIVRGGTTFRFAVPAAGHQTLLRGIVQLAWRRGGRSVRTGRVRTSAGHAAQSGGSSRAECVIRR